MKKFWKFVVQTFHLWIIKHRSKDVQVSSSKTSRTFYIRHKFENHLLSSITQN